MSEYQFRKIKKEIAEQQKDEFGHEFCERCGTSQGPFDVHHIIYRSELRQGNSSHPEVHNRLNLIKVCSFRIGNCHEWFHEEKSRRDYLVEERSLKQFYNLQKYGR